MGDVGTDRPAAVNPAARRRLRQWGSELVGTFLFLAVGFPLVALLFAPQSPLAVAVPGLGLRRLIIGCVFGALAIMLAEAPTGRLSGGHLNPAVTFAFWLRGHVPPIDLIGYAAAQCLGALAGTVIFALSCGPWASSIDYARTQPRVGLGDPQAMLVEAGLTATFIVVVLLFVSSAGTERWTPLAAGAALACVISIGAGATGASVNPARFLGPALLSGHHEHLAVYLVGPLLGAAVAVAAHRILAGGRGTRTAHLRRDGRYPNTLTTPGTKSQTTGAAFKDSR